MIKRNVLSSMACVAALAVTVPVHAADTGFYAGFNVGQSKFHIDKSDFDAQAVDAFTSQGFPVLNATSSLDDTDTSFSAVIGYRFLPYLAAELTYIDLGEASYRASGTVSLGGSPAPADLDLKIQAKGPALSAMGIWPVTDSFDLYGRLGVFFAKVTESAGVDINGFGGSDSISDNSQEVFAGIGAAYNFATHWTVRAEWQRFKDVGNPDTTGEGDIDSFTLGVLFRM